MLHNDSHLFISRNETLKIVNNQTPFTHLYEANQEVVYPVAHGEGITIVQKRSLMNLNKIIKLSLSILIILMVLMKISQALLIKKEMFVE